MRKHSKKGRNIIFFNYMRRVTILNKAFIEQPETTMKKLVTSIFVFLFFVFPAGAERPKVQWAMSSTQVMTILEKDNNFHNITAISDTGENKPIVSAAISRNGFNQLAQFMFDKNDRLVSFSMIATDQNGSCDAIRDQLYKIYNHPSVYEAKTGALSDYARWKFNNELIQFARFNRHNNKACITRYKDVHNEL